MKQSFLTVLIISSIIIGFISCSNGQQISSPRTPTDSIVIIEMNLSAYGVESDDFPSIEAVIDFPKDTSICVRSFYNPAYKGSIYSLTKSEMQSIINLLKSADLGKLKKEYKISTPDQPRSTTKIFTTTKTFVFDDYGLRGDYPLKELYSIVYKLK